MSSSANNDVTLLPQAEDVRVSPVGHRRVKPAQRWESAATLMDRHRGQTFPPGLSHGNWFRPMIAGQTGRPCLLRGKLALPAAVVENSFGEVDTGHLLRGVAEKTEKDANMLRALLWEDSSP